MIDVNTILGDPVETQDGNVIMPVSRVAFGLSLIHISSVFSGPLDLMLSLIEKREIDICEVSISEIADDYLEHVASMEWLDIDQAAEFLVIAATLLYLSLIHILSMPTLAQRTGWEIRPPGGKGVSLSIHWLTWTL